MRNKERFIRYMQQQNLAESTQKHILYAVNRFLQWLGKEPENTTKKDILDYLSHLQTHYHHQNKSRQVRLFALRHYFACLHHHGLIASNPTAFIQIRGTRKKILYPLFDFDQLMQLIDDYHHVFIRTFDESYIPANQRIFSHLKRHRNHVLLGFFIHQGIRTREIHRIRIGHIDLNQARVHIHGQTARILPLHATQIGPLMHYLNEIRPQILHYHTTETDQLFLPLPESGKKTAKSTSTATMPTTLSRQLKQISGRYRHLNQIRASVITRWIKLYGLRKAQYMAGHKSIITTEQYLDNDWETLRDQIDKYNPF